MLRVLRVHLAEPRSDPLQLTNYGDGRYTHAVGIIALEPSGRAVITEDLGLSIQVSDWTSHRGVEITPIGPDCDGIFVRTHPSNRHQKICTQTR